MMGRTDGKLAVNAKLAAREKLAAVKHAVEPQAKVVKLSLCSVSFLALAFKTVALVLFYYVFSIGLTFYNKRFIKVSLRLNTFSADDIFKYFSYFSMETGFDISCKFFPVETICICQILFSGKKNI